MISQSWFDSNATKFYNVIFSNLTCFQNQPLTNEQDFFSKGITVCNTYGAAGFIRGLIRLIFRKRLKMVVFRQIPLRSDFELVFG